MGRYIYKHTCVIPFTEKENIDLVMEKMGYGPDNFNIPLVLDESNNGDITHYAAPLTMDKDMLVMMDNLLIKHSGVRYEADFRDFI